MTTQTVNLPITKEELEQMMNKVRKETAERVAKEISGKLSKEDKKAIYKKKRNTEGTARTAAIVAMAMEATGLAESEIRKAFNEAHLAGRVDQTQYKPLYNAKLKELIGWERPWGKQ